MNEETLKKKKRFWCVLYSDGPGHCEILGEPQKRKWKCHEICEKNESLSRELKFKVAIYDITTIQLMGITNNQRRRSTYLLHK